MDTRKDGQAFRLYDARIMARGGAERMFNDALVRLELASTRGDPLHDMIYELFPDSPHAEAPIAIGGKKRGIVLRNPVGIPAGFTKHGDGMWALAKIGAGFIELGTIVPLPQPGNPQPRFFLDFLEHRPEENYFLAVNRFGFNHIVGIEIMAEWVRSRLEHYSLREDDPIVRTPLVWSFGPNKTTMDRYEETRDLQLVADDILFCLIHSLPVLRGNDAVQFNVASPNTPGLRALFDHFQDLLDRIIEGMRTIAGFYRQPPPPCLIKLSPDMKDEQMRTVARIAAGYDEVIGLEAFNTTVNASIREKFGITEAGGVSGDPLRPLAYSKLITLHEIIMEEGLDLDLIAVGGIMTPEHGIERLQIGERVKAVQVFTGLFKYGLSLIPDTLKDIAHVHGARLAAP